MVSLRCRHWASSLLLLACCVRLGTGAESSHSSYQAEKQSQGGSSNAVLPGKVPNEVGTNAVYSPPTKDPQQYRSAYYYSPQQQYNQQLGGVPLWNRDSYADAASDFGYSPDSGAQHAQHGQHGGSFHSSGAYGASEVSEGYGDFDGIGGGAGGLAGLVGLLGIKGLKGLGLLGLLKAGILPILFLLLPALLLLPLLLFFLPIPVITIPQPAANGRSFGLDVKDLGGRMSSLARSVMDSEKCIERISCELSRYSRGTFIDKTLKRMIFKFEQHMPSPLQRMARAYIEPVPGSGCQRYGCFLMDDASIKKHKKST